MSAAPFSFTDDQKREFARALCEHVGKPWDAAVAVFGHLKNPGIVLYAANVLSKDFDVAREMQRLMTADHVGASLGTKDQAARTVWEWTQQPGPLTKEKIAAMQLYAELQGYVSKDATPQLPAVPPIIQYVVDPDADKPPSRSAESAAA